MAKDVLIAYDLADGCNDYTLLSRLMVQGGWLQTEVSNVMLKTYKDVYPDEDILGSAKAEFEDRCADASVEPRSCVISVCKGTPGLFSRENP
jgi:hypothetical protein